MQTFYTKFIIIATCDIHSCQFRQHLWYLSSTSTVHFSPHLLERLRHNSFHSFGSPGLDGWDHTIDWQNPPGWQISSNICLHVTMFIDMNERLVGYNDIFLYLSASVLIRARRSKRQCDFQNWLRIRNPSKRDFGQFQPAKSINFTNFISLLSIWTAYQNPPPKISQAWIPLPKNQGPRHRLLPSSWARIISSNEPNKALKAIRSNAKTWISRGWALKFLKKHI